MDEERVEYSYTGDVSSLRNATKEAISLLNKYESTIKDLAQSNKLEVGKTTFTGFQRSLNGVIKQVNSLTSFINKASDETQGALIPDAASVNTAYESIQDTLSFLQSSSRITADDLKLVTLYLKDAKATLDPVVAKTQALSSNFTKVAQVVERSNSTIGATKEQVASVGQQWDAYISRMSKSAEMSAQVFAEHGEFTDFMAAVDNTVTKVVLMKSRVTEAAEAMVAELKSMSGVFDPISVRVKSFKAKAANALDQVRQAADSVSAAFRRTAQSAEDADDQASQLSAGFQQVENATRETATRSSSLATILTKLDGTLSSNTKRVNGFSNSLKKAISPASLLKKALRSLTGISIGAWFADAAKKSIEYVENLNLFTVAMGNSVQKGLEFVDTMSELYGMDPSNLYRYSGYFYQLTDAIGMTDEASSMLSLSMTKAANDIASLFNVDIETTVENLAAGLQGMSRSVRKYGMDIRTTTLQQTALKYGITESVDSMSEANRMALRYITMMTQVKNATSQTVSETDGLTEVMGDFARTIESPANQLRIFKEQITQLGRAIGNFFIPTLQKVLPIVNGFVMALRIVLTTMSTLVGYSDNLVDSTENLGDSAGAVEDIGDAASGATKQIKKMLAPFDELNVLADQTSSTESGDILDPALQEAIENMELGLENIQMKANKIRDTILEFLGFKTVDVFNPETGAYEETIQWFADIFQQNLIDKFPKWSSTITALFENWEGITQGLENVWKSLGTVLDTVLSKVSKLLKSFGIDNELSGGISSLGESLTGFASWIDEHRDTIADFAIAVVGLSVAFKGLKTAISAVANLKSIASILQPILKMFTSSSGGAALGSLSSTVAIIAGIVATVVVLYNTFEEFAQAFDELLQSIVEGFKPVLQAVTKLFSTVWQSIKKLWAENIKPMLQKTGEALAPVLQTLGKLWKNVSGIVTDAIQMLERVWTSSIEPLIVAATKAVSGIMEIVQILWETCLGPIIENIGQSLEHLWQQTLSPLVEDVLGIANGISELVYNLWNILQPFVQFFVTVLGPSITATFNFIWSVVELVIGLIGSALAVLTGALSGVIEFLNGVFTGDWKRGLSGILNILVSLGNAIIGVIESVCNLCINAINSFLEFTVGSFRGLINGIGGLIEDIGSFFGADWEIGVNWAVPQISRVTIPRIPKAALASGGVVTKPTQALIGEGKYDEAVIPLGNSPQMRDLVDQIAAATGKKTEDEVVQVNVYLGNELVAEHMVKAERKRRIQTNGG